MWKCGWRTAVAMALGALCLPLAGCGAASDAKPPGQAIRVMPGHGAEDVARSGPVKVTVPEGRLERVRVRRTGGEAGADARPLRGRLSGDGRSWRVVGRSLPLSLAAKYEVDAVALDGQGRRVARHTTFTTHVPDHRFIGFFTPEHRETVGTGTIVSLDFNKPVRDRAAVERAVRVTSKPAVPVAAHWFGNQRLDFRPREYWAPGTRITLDLRLRDVRVAPGAYGIQHKRVHFRVGRDQHTVIDAKAKTMTVRRDGKVVQRSPVTAGRAKTPTYNGRMVISEKFDVTRMNGSTVGFGGEYDIDDVPHAIRLTRSGTFLHGNYWAPADVFGSDNISHGCVGLRDKKGGSSASPAGRYFRSALVGDVVEVKGSKERTVAPDNGLGGWNMPWDEWTAGSALN